jgi:hypothetical protein
MWRSKGRPANRDYTTLAISHKYGLSGWRLELPPAADELGLVSVFGLERAALMGSGSLGRQDRRAANPLAYRRLSVLP